MYLEFTLPANSVAAKWLSSHITRDLDLFCKLHDYSYRIELADRRLLVEFDQSTAYTMISLDWSGMVFSIHNSEKITA